MFLAKKTEDLFNAFSTEVFKPEVLDEKTQELIAVAVSVMADCIPCVKHHYPKAVAAGATQEEIAAAFAIAMSVSAGSKKGKFAPVVAELEQQ